MRSTTLVNSGDIQRDWYHVDAEGLVLGRIAVVIARYLQGKNKPNFTPHVDMGDFIVVTNVDKIVVTGRKAETMEYERYTRYPGGLKSTTYAQMKEKKPEEILRLAVRRMLPKNALGRRRLKKLKVYVGTDHPHQAQSPKPLPEEAAWLRTEYKPSKRDE